MKDIQIVTVTEPPAIGKPEMCQGIRNETSAKTWAVKNGYAKVYWFKKRERVYADKAAKSVSQLQLA